MVIAGSYYICIFHKFTHNLFHFAFINTKIPYIIGCTCLIVYELLYIPTYHSCSNN